MLVGTFLALSPVVIGWYISRGLPKGSKLKGIALLIIGSIAIVIGIYLVGDYSELFGTSGPSYVLMGQLTVLGGIIAALWGLVTLMFNLKGVELFNGTDKEGKEIQKTLKQDKKKLKEDEDDIDEDETEITKREGKEGKKEKVKDERLKSYESEIKKKLEYVRLSVETLQGREVRIEKAKKKIKKILEVKLGELPDAFNRQYRKLKQLVSFDLEKSRKTFAKCQREIQAAEQLITSSRVEGLKSEVLTGVKGDLRRLRSDFEKLDDIFKKRK